MNAAPRDMMLVELATDEAKFREANDEHASLKTVAEMRLKQSEALLDYLENYAAKHPDELTDDQREEIRRARVQMGEIRPSLCRLKPVRQKGKSA